MVKTNLRSGVYRVRKTAMALARTHPSKVELLVVELGIDSARFLGDAHVLTFRHFLFRFIAAASLLHDVLDKKYVSAEQASDPYSFFLPFFEGVASRHEVDLISDGRGKLVAQIIDNVSWSTDDLVGI